MKPPIQQDLRAFYACARHCDRTMIILKGKKRVRWMTEPARHCVAEFFGDLPKQANRLLDPTNDRKSIDEMLRLLSVLGYTVEWSVVTKAA